jgi:hypothetical protein
MVYGRDVLDNLQVPYRFFGHDSSMMSVLQHAMEIDTFYKAKAV